MESRNLLNLTVALIAGAATLTFAAAAQAAPVPPISTQQNIQPSLAGVAEPALVSQDEIDRLKPVEARWGHHGTGITGAGIMAATGAGTMAAIGAGTTGTGRHVGETQGGLSARKIN